MPFDTTTFWTLKVFDSKPENELTLRFINFQNREGNFFYHAVGKGPVNGYGCLVQVLKDNKLLVSELNQTMIAAVEPEKNRLEQKLMAALQKVHSYKLTASELSLYYPDGIMVFVK